jgi:hypothetical protein
MSHAIEVNLTAKQKHRLELGHMVQLKPDQLVGALNHKLLVDKKTHTKHRKALREKRGLRLQVSPAIEGAGLHHHHKHKHGGSILDVLSGLFGGSLARQAMDHGRIHLPHLSEPELKAVSKHLKAHGIEHRRVGAGFSFGDILKGVRTAANIIAPIAKPLVQNAVGSVVGRINPGLGKVASNAVGYGYDKLAGSGMRHHKGGSLQKGSAEAKAKMAKLRAMKNHHGGALLPAGFY